MVFPDLGDIAQRHCRRRILHAYLGEVGRGPDREDVLDAEALAGGLNETAGSRCGRFEETQRRNPHRVAGGLDDLFEGDSLVPQLRGRDLDLELLLALTPDGNVRHTRNADQPRFDLPTGQDRHFDAGELLGAHLDHQHPARGRDGLHDQRRRRYIRQRHGLGHPFRDELAGPQQIRARLEDQLDGGQPRDGFRPDLVQPGHPIEEIRFHRGGNKLLNFDSGEAQGFRLDFDLRRREFGHGVHGDTRGTLMMPKAIIPAARASTRMRNCRLKRVIQPNMASRLPGCFRWARSARPDR